MDPRLSRYHSAEFTCRFSRASCGIDRSDHDERRRDIHPITDGPHAVCNANWWKYPRCILRCPGPPSAQGWTFGLPNAVYRTPEGTTFDVQGIPPDITVPRIC